MFQIFPDQKSCIQLKYYARIFKVIMKFLADYADPFVYGVPVTEKPLCTKLNGAFAVQIFLKSIQTAAAVIPVIDQDG